MLGIVDYVRKGNRASPMVRKFRVLARARIALCVHDVGESRCRFGTRGFIFHSSLGVVIKPFTPLSKNEGEAAPDECGNNQKSEAERDYWMSVVDEMGRRFSF